MINPNTPSYHLLLLRPPPGDTGRDFAFRPEECVGGSLKWICKQDGKTQALREVNNLGGLLSVQDTLASVTLEVLGDGAGYATLYSPHVSRVYEQMMYWYLLRNPTEPIPGVRTNADCPLPVHG